MSLRQYFPCSEVLYVTVSVYMRADSGSAPRLATRIGAPTAGDVILFSVHANMYYVNVCGMQWSDAARARASCVRACTQSAMPPQPLPIEDPIEDLIRQSRTLSYQGSLHKRSYCRSY